jgi:hypothetical protein
MKSRLNITIKWKAHHIFAAAAMLGAISPLGADAQNLLLNGSFETLSQSVASDTYTTGFGSLPVTVATGWTLGTSGVNNGYDGIAESVNGALSNFATKDIEDGLNAVFLQGAGSVSQTLTLGIGQYALSYYEMGRPSAYGGNGANPVTASLSGGLVNDVETPANTDITAASDWSLYTDNFSVTTAGSYTLQFLGDDAYGVAGDHTTFLDNVSIQAVPEPSSVALIGLGAFGALFGRRLIPVKTK